MKSKKIILALIITCCIEIFYFNFFPIVQLLDNNVEKNIEYRLKDMLLLNWNKENGYIISQKDPNLIIEHVNTYIKKNQARYGSKSSSSLYSSILY